MNSAASNNAASVTMDKLGELMGNSADMDLLVTIWKSVGTEIVAFAVTAILAYSVRFLPQRVNLFPKKSCADSMRNVPARRVPRAYVAAPAAPEVSQSPQSNLIDDIMALMQNNPGQRSAGRALQIYSELRHSITASEGGCSMLDAVQHSQHTSLDFYTMLVQCAVRAQKSCLVCDIVDDMVLHQVPRPISFYESTMKQLAGQKQHQLALNMYDRLDADGLEPSAVTYSCLISFTAEVGDCERAMFFFEKLASISTPSIRAYMTVFRVLQNQRDWTRTLATFRDMQKRNVQVDHLVLNIVLATGVAVGKVDEAEALVADGSCSEFCDAVSYNTLIKGHARRNDGDSACRAVARMRKNGLRPTLITFNTVMDAIIRDHRSCSGLAWKVLEQMRDLGMKPDKFTCSTLVKGFCKNPCVPQVKPILDVLEEADRSCDGMLKSTLYHNLLDAVARFSDEGPFLSTFAQMTRNGVKLNDVASRKFRDRMTM